MITKRAVTINFHIMQLGQSGYMIAGQLGCIPQRQSPWMKHDISIFSAAKQASVDILKYLTLTQSLNLTNYVHAVVPARTSVPYIQCTTGTIFSTPDHSMHTRTSKEDIQKHKG
jgi:hypothetical protein